MATWYSKALGLMADKWDEWLVYLFTFGGVIGHGVYVARLDGKTFHTDFWALAAAVVVSLGLSWLAENRGVKAAEKAGVIDAHRTGKRRNIMIRLFLGASFGFIGQMALPQVLDVVGKFVVGSIQATLGGVQ